MKKLFSIALLMTSCLMISAEEALAVTHKIVHDGIVNFAGTPLVMIKKPRIVLSPSPMDGGSSKIVRFDNSYNTRDYLCSYFGFQSHHSVDDYNSYHSEVPVASWETRTSESFWSFNFRKEGKNYINKYIKCYKF